MNAPKILKVAVNVPLSRLFDYRPPSGQPPAAIGARVRVPFGRRKLTGVVMGISDESDVDASKLKSAIETLDAAPLLSDEDLWLIRFTSDYYHHPIGEVMAAALPALIRKGGALTPTLEFLTATSTAGSADLDALAKRAPKQAELLTTLIDAGVDGLDSESLNAILQNWRRPLRPLIDKGLVTRAERAAYLRTTVEPTDGMPGPPLNAAQQQAVDGAGSATGFAPYLLDGVTGSGKTEVYLELIRRTIDTGRQALVLVPEIGLTPQLIERFRLRLGLKPALLHSGLTDLERLDAWREARAGGAPLVVGTRSAVFTPLPKLGLVIVDEEHDASFKQQEGLRYSARDLAIARAKRAGCPIVLGSATPTLELLRHCRDGGYTRLVLPERAGGARPPRLRIVDTSRDYSDDGLSNALGEAVRRHLDAGGQALLYLNRRGFAPALVCPACNHIAECRRCDSRMTVHAADRQLRCHHCGAGRPLDEVCSECGAEVRALGAGTERLEEALKTRFPQRRIARIDSDTTQRKGEMDAALASAQLGRSDILVGTQMLSKGHHFPKLTLVGIVNADQGLFGTDFRSDERMAQSIVQVAGRAGREESAGEVLIQTAFPRHPFWSRLIESGYAGIAGDALAEREKANWPPYSRLALIRAAAHKHRDTHAFLEAARHMIGDDAGVRVLGPVDAVMARRAGRYRAQLLLVANERRLLHGLLRRLRPGLEDAPLARRVRWSIDVDPIELY